MRITQLYGRWVDFDAPTICASFDLDIGGRLGVFLPEALAKVVIENMGKIGRNASSAMPPGQSPYRLPGYGVIRDRQGYWGARAHAAMRAVGSELGHDLAASERRLADQWFHSSRGAKLCTNRRHYGDLPTCQRRSNFSSGDDTTASIALTRGCQDGWPQHANQVMTNMVSAFQQLDA